MKQTYCGDERGHIPHPNDDGTQCGGYPPSDGGMIKAGDIQTENLHTKQLTWPAVGDTTEWWFTLRHGSPELNCPNTGKSWALQATVLGGLVPLPAIMMCISCGTALTLVDNGPTPPEGEQTT